jgi:ABC-type transport system involved in multi-copper enzyme maturation permease subunit
MSTIPGIVAVNTFREAVRDRVLYNLIFFALLMMGTAVLVGGVSIGIERDVIVNLGLTAISVFGILMAIFIGVGLVHKEIEKRTLYSLLAKPVQRWQFLVGKFGGLVLTLTVNTALMMVGLAAIYFILLELALITSLALLFSCFSTPMLSTLYTVGIYIAGVFAPNIRDIGVVTAIPVARWMATAVYYLLPNFHNFNVMAAAAHQETIPAALIWQNTLYAALYIAVVLLAAAAIFSSRDLK